MKEINAAPKAEGANENQKSEIRDRTHGTNATDRERNPGGVQEWWASLSAGERRLISSVMGLLRGAKRSQLRDVANAAAKWERGIGCFIKVRLMSASRAGQQRKARLTISYPSALRSQRGVSQARD